jgi:xanthine dehydrogenase/oxidase
MMGKFTTLQAAVVAFNKDNKFRKRGISMSPSRFGMMHDGPFNAYVAVHADGTINITHGGVEIGQGVHTKVAQGCAKVFGLTKTDVQQYIKIQPFNSTISTDMGNITGGSITSELCTRAVMRACDKIVERMKPYRTEGSSWRESVAASMGNVDLTANGFGKREHGDSGEQIYNTWGCGLSVVEVDTLTGQFEIKETDLLFDCGISMNPAIDVGQVEGGFMFGVGWFTSEEVKWDPTTGYAEMAGSWRYKPPGAYDVPEVLNVTLLENSNNKVGVLNSKAVGEPPLALAVSVVHALENAINASRTEMGLASMVVTSTPLTVDKVQAACGVSASNLVIPTSS